MSGKTQRLIIILWLAAVIMSGIGMGVLHYLGSQERRGYIVLLDDPEIEVTPNNYRVRLRYHTAFLRSNFIYDAQISNANLPPEVQAIRWDPARPHFGVLIANRALDKTIPLENIAYTLQIKAVFYWWVWSAIIWSAILLYLFGLPANARVKQILRPFWARGRKIILTLAAMRRRLPALLFALIFFAGALFAEWRLFDNETSKEVLDNVVHPHYYSQAGAFLMPFFLENPQYLGARHREPLSPPRREIKAAALLAIDLFGDNHISGNLYAALKTGKNLDELRSHNFLRMINPTTWATFADFATPTLYTSTPHWLTKFYYATFPLELRQINTAATELAAARHYHQLKKYFLAFHLLLWSLLIYVVGSRWGILYALGIAAGIFCLPGFSLIAASPVLTFNLIPLFPLYILAFYPLAYAAKTWRRKGFFYCGLFVLIGADCLIGHAAVAFFQLPIILLTLAFCHCWYHYRPLYTRHDLWMALIAHAKQYLGQYAVIAALTLLMVYGGVYVSYREMLRLQPENAEIIKQLVWERPSGAALNLSLVLLDPNDKGDREKYRVDYSLSNRVGHNILTSLKYLTYPIFYPLWLLEQFLPAAVAKILYCLPPYLSLFDWGLLAMVLNILLWRRARGTVDLITPAIFIGAAGLWIFLFFNVAARIATHFHEFPHVVLQYLSPLALVYVLYLSVSLAKSTDENSF